MKTKGFTLIEIVTVIVLLSIVTLGTTRFIVQSTQQYTDSARRSQLMAQGRVLVEQLTRRLRNALPNSVRISGNCIEFFPVITAAGLVDPLPLIPVNQLLTGGFGWSYSGISYASAMPLATSEVYKASYGSEEVIKEVSSVNGSAGEINLTGFNQFPHHSKSERVFLVGEPERYCRTGSGQLIGYRNYGIKANLDASDPGGTTVLLADKLDTSVTPFVYSPGSLIENAVVKVTLSFSDQGEVLELSHEVHIRNVP